MDSNLDVQLYLEGRLGLGAQQDSPDRYSYGGANSHSSYVDQGALGNKVQVRLELT